MLWTASPVLTWTCIGAKVTPVVGFDQQRGREVVTDIRLVSELEQIFLAFGLRTVRQLAPIMCQQHEIRLTARAAVSTELSQRLDEL